eukprot:1970833-Pleurochrysis_carterae.AAC.1
MLSNGYQGDLVRLTFSDLPGTKRRVKPVLRIWSVLWSIRGRRLPLLRRTNAVISVRHKLCFNPCTSLVLMAPGVSIVNG